MKLVPYTVIGSLVLLTVLQMGRMGTFGRWRRNIRSVPEHWETKRCSVRQNPCVFHLGSSARDLRLQYGAEHLLQQHLGGGTAGESRSFPEVLPRPFCLSKLSQLQEESAASVLTSVSSPRDSPMSTHLDFHEHLHPFLRASLCPQESFLLEVPVPCWAPPIHYPTL